MLSADKKFPTIKRVADVSEKNESLPPLILSTEELFELGAEALTALLMRLNKELNKELSDTQIIQLNRDATESPGIDRLFNHKQFITLVPYSDSNMPSAGQSFRLSDRHDSAEVKYTNWELLLYFIIESHLKIVMTNSFSELREHLEEKRPTHHRYCHEEAFICIKLWIFGHIAYQRYLKNVKAARDYSSFIEEFLTSKNGRLNQDEGFLLNKKNIMTSITYDMIKHFHLRKEYWENKLKTPSWLDKMVYTHFLALIPKLKSPQQTIIFHKLSHAFE